MVETGGLENRFTLTGNGGSNPSPSATQSVQTAPSQKAQNLLATAPPSEGGCPMFATLRTWVKNDPAKPYPCFHSIRRESCFEECWLGLQ